MHAPTDSPLRRTFSDIAERLMRRQAGVRGAFQQIYAMKEPR